MWARGIWSVAVTVACGAAAIGAQQNQPAQQNQGANQAGQQNQIGQPAQNNQRQPWNGAGANAGMAAAGKADIDHYLIKVLVKANKDEIELGKLAQQRSQNADVKQFATQMVQDHTGFLNKLEAFKKSGNMGAGTQVGTQQPVQRGTAYRGNPEGTPAENGLNQQQSQQIPNPQVGQQQAGGNNPQPRLSGKRMHREHVAGMAGMNEHGGAAEFAKIMEEVDRNVQQAAVRDLSSKQGAQFDRCYLTNQMFCHMWVAEALKTFEQNASPQLKPVLQEGVQATEQHLTHLKMLLAKVEGAPASPSAQLQPRGNRFNR
jgi:predicted outer membrane protein